MKVRIRFGSEKDFVIVQESVPNLSHLREAVRCKLNLSRETEFDLSLNGKDVLQNEESSLLSELGIVSGDMIYIINTEPRTVDNNAATRHVLDSVLLTQLTDMGFSQEDAVKALQATDCTTLENALENLLVQHSTPNSAKEPSSDSPGNPVGVSEQEESVIFTDRSGGPQDVPDDDTGVGISSDGSGRTVVTDLSVPVLCRDGIPHLLDKIYSDSSVSTLHDALCIVVHVLMMETGFQFVSTKKDVSVKEETAMEIEQSLIPVTSSGSGLTKLSYQHPNCPGIKTTVSLTSVGNFIMAYGFTEDIEDSEIYQCRICVTDYVKSSVSLNQGPTCVYQNLHKLSRLIKDQLALPLIAASRSYLGLPELHGFLALPPEVKVKIVLMLDVKSILKLSGVCKELYSFVGDNNLWRHLLLRDFKQTICTDCKKEYITLHKKNRKSMPDFFFEDPLRQPHFSINPSRPFPTPMYPPGIIGGFHDLHPPLPFMPGHPDPGLPGPLPGFSPHGPFVPGRPRFDPYGPLGEDMDINQASHLRRPNQRTQNSFRGTGFFPRFL